MFLKKYKMYRLVKVTDINKLNKRDLTSLNLAIDEAEKSPFHQPKKIGSVLEYGYRKLYGPQRT
jgi:hypothetical protein